NPVAPTDLLRTVASAGERWQRRVAEEELERALLQTRMSEERYRTIIETAREGVCVVGLDGLIQYANERMAAILAQTPAQLVGRPFLDVLAADDRAAAAAVLGEPQRDGEDHEFRIVRTDGGTVWAWMSTR